LQETKSTKHFGSSTSKMKNDQANHFLWSHLCFKPQHRLQTDRIFGGSFRHWRVSV